MTAYDDLMAFQRETEALAQVAGRLGWDQETMMPRGAAEQRGEEMAAMEDVLHARRTDPRIGDWLADGDRHARRRGRRPTCATSAAATSAPSKVPAQLAAEIARVTSVAQGIWAEARAAEDFAAFAPTLARGRRPAARGGAALAPGGDLYDALLDDYEPGATGAEIDAMFDALRPRLVAPARRDPGCRAASARRLTGDVRRGRATGAVDANWRAPSAMT